MFKNYKINLENIYQMRQNNTISRYANLYDLSVVSTIFEHELRHYARSQ